MSNHSLTWGVTDDDALLLTGDLLDGDYWFETVAESATLGEPEPVEVGLTSLLLDGTQRQTSRHDNRSPAFRIAVKAHDATSLAAGEAALFKMSQRRGTSLTWTPPDIFGAPTAFDVEVARMSFLFDDLAEMRGVLTRTYQMTWECRPWARSVNETVQAAVAINYTAVSVDDCTSATGWSASYGTVAVSSGAVVNTRNRDRWAEVVRAGAIDMAGMPYMRVEWSSSVGVLINASAVASGSTWWTEVYREQVGGNTRSYFHVGDLPIDASGIRVGVINGLTTGTMTFSIHDLSRVSSLPDSGTGGTQQLTVIAPGGSARTQGQIEVVSTGTNALGEVTLYTAPLGHAYTPSMRRWLYSSDTPTPNSTGSFQTITGPSAYDIPAPTIPVGGYVIAARMMCTTTATVKIVWSLQTLVNGVVVGDYLEEAPAVDFVANKWNVIPLGLATLPTSIVGTAGVIRLGIQRETGSSATVNLHDTFLFHEDGDLTIVDCGSGTSAAGGPSRRLRVLPPSSDRPGGGLEMGHAADWSDAFASGAKAVARPARGHVLHPEGTSVFVMTPGLNAGSPAQVSGRWFKRHHTHAVD